MMVRYTVAVLTAVLLSVAACALSSQSTLRRDLRQICWPEDGKINALGAFDRAGESGRKALLRLARSSDWYDAECGIGGLSMLGEERVVPPLVARLNRSASAQNPHAELLSWALQLSALSDLRENGRSLAQTLERHISGPSGSHAFATLGHIDDPDARAIITRELRSTSGDRLGYAILAAAVQGDVGSLEIVRQASNRPDFQDAKRREWVAVYFLTVDSKTMAEGLAVLDSLPSDSRDFIASWAAQSLCVRSKRQPHSAALDQHRRELIREFNSRRLAWYRGPLVVCTDLS